MHSFQFLTWLKYGDDKDISTGAERFNYFFTIFIISYTYIT